MKAHRSDWRIPVALVALSLVPARAGTARLLQLAGGAAITPENARFFADPLPVTHLPWFVFVGGKPSELPRGVMMGAGWVINVAVAEWIIRRGPSRSRMSVTTVG